MSDPNDQPGGLPSAPSAQGHGAYGAPMPPISPMPAAAPQAVTPAGPAPATVVNAARLMLVSAALGVVGIIVLLVSKDALRTAVRKKNPTYDDKKLSTVVNAAIVTDVVLAVIFIVLYVWLSRQVLKGKNWARVTALVFAGLGVVSGLLSLANPMTVATRVLELVTVVIDLGIFIFLMQKPSLAFFGRQRRRR